MYGYDTWLCWWEGYYGYPRKSGNGWPTERTTEGGLRRIEGFIKHLLFNRKEVTEEHIKEVWTDAELTDTEVGTILRVTKALLPFSLHMKEGKKTAGFGLSLVLLANYVLRITGYSSYTPEMSPMKSASAIDAHWRSRLFMQCSCLERPPQDSLRHQDQMMYR